MALLGTFILAFGWFGFNAGSTLAGTDSRIAVIAVNTMLAGAMGGVAAMIYTWTRFGKPDPGMMANGTLAGLVAITAPCAFVTAPVAVLIGTISGVLVSVAAPFIEKTLRVDDPVGAIAVHGVNGLFGVLAVGLFADGTYGDGTNGVVGGVRGLFYGDGTQILAQGMGAIANITWVGLSAFVAWKITGVLVGGHRVSSKVEDEGLDLPEMGVLAYPADLASAAVLPEAARRKAVEAA
jgi:Amt family ammonium transporter